jgi:tryptophan synthase alpha chain
MADGATEATARRTGATGEERIAGAFAGARERGRAALMPYMVGGFPDSETATTIARAYVDSGADLIELGVPFSDPLADGPVIHAAATEALAAGASIETVLETCSVVADRVPVILMVYANMALAGGGGRLASRLREAGAAGAIVPDLPLEEADEMRESLAGEGLALAPLVAPTTPPQRRREICARARGFVYVVSTVGVTGERDELAPELTELVAATRDAARVPVAVGFGISTPGQVATVGAVADGVIVGSRLVRAVSAAPDRESAATAVGGFLRASADALSQRR